MPRGRGEIAETAPPAAAADPVAGDVIDPAAMLPPVTHDPACCGGCRAILEDLYVRIVAATTAVGEVTAALDGGGFGAVMGLMKGRGN